jgi:glutathione S-transferase
MNVLLYHTPNAICAQKVRVCLAEKGVRYDTIDLTGKLRDPAYLRINPNGYVPTLIHGDRVMWESRVVSEYVDGAFPGPALLPHDPFQRAQAALWSKQIDDSLHLNVFTLSFAAIFRPAFLAMSEEQRSRNLAFDITKRERTIDLIAQGWDSRFVVIALQRFIRLADDMETALQGQPWLVGGQYSLADADLTPYLQRLTDLGLSGLWRSRPALSAWFDRVRGRPSFDEVIVNWHSAEDLARAKLNREAAEPIFRELLAGVGELDRACSKPAVPAQTAL